MAGREMMLMGGWGVRSRRSPDFRVISPKTSRVHGLSSDFLAGQSAKRGRSGAWVKVCLGDTRGDLDQGLTTPPWIRTRFDWLAEPTTAGR